MFSKWSTWLDLIWVSIILWSFLLRLECLQTSNSCGWMIIHSEKYQLRLLTAKSLRNLISRIHLLLHFLESWLTLQVCWCSTWKAAQWKRASTTATLVAWLRFTPISEGRKIGRYSRSSCLTSWLSGSIPLSPRKMSSSKLRSYSTALRIAIPRCSRNSTVTVKDSSPQSFKTLIQFSLERRSSSSRRKDRHVRLLHSSLPESRVTTSMNHLPTSLLSQLISLTRLAVNKQLINSSDTSLTYSRDLWLTSPLKRCSPTSQTIRN